MAEFMAELLYWSALDCTCVFNKEATYPVHKQEIQNHLKQLSKLCFTDFIY